MHKRISKAITASFMAAAMLTTTVATVAPMSVSAGMMVGESEFTKKALPWHTCETSPAKQNFEIVDGKFKVTVVNPGGAAAGGESRWDLQFRHRKLTIKKDHTYKIHWEVTAEQSCQIYTKIGDLSGDVEVWHNNCNNSTFGQCWDPLQISKGTHEYDAEFTADKDVEVAEWAFHYGGAGAHQATPCTKEGDVLYFDNMTLECTTCPDEYSEDTCNWDFSDDFGVMTRDNSKLENNYISVNQVGYFTNLSKVATLGDNAGGGEDQSSISLGNSPLEFKLINNSTGETAYTGTTTPCGADADSGDNVHKIDFTEFTTEGEYYIQCGDYVSFPFEIGNDIYSESGNDMLTNAMNYYYQNRSGIDIESKYITSGDKSNLAHAGGHNPDKAYVQSEWVKSYSGEFDGDKTYQIDGVGGWYDAGDHGKYVVNGGISVWTLQNMYERAVANDADEKFADGSGTVVVPETGNGAPDILDETKVELDWMMKMVVSSDDPYWKQYEGLVYHKLHDHKWTGLATTPADTDGDGKADYEDEWGTTRIVKPPSFAATLNFVACAAQGARLWEDIDPSYASELLTAAKKSYDAYIKNFYEYTDAEKTNTKSLYAPLDQAIGGGAYGDNNVKDDAYWAACELYATTGDSKYYNDLKSYEEAFEVVTTLSGGENNDSFGSFNWGNTASLGSITLYLNSDKITDSELSKIEDTIVSASDTYIAMEEEQGYGIPYRGTTFTDEVNIGPDPVTGYEWGSNSFVVNNAMVMAYAYDIKDDIKYINGVSTAMDYIFGRNPLSVSYVTGYGDYHISRPHHRYWSNELDSSFPVAPSGVMSGGPGSGMQDPYIGGLGYKRGTLAPQRCYVDSIEAWSVNEVTINWNAPFAWVVSFLQDEAANVSTEGKLVVTPSKVEVAVGETETIEATINGEKVDASFKSSDDSIAKVDSNGTITGVGEGTAKIEITVGDQTTTITVTVTAEATSSTEPTEDSTGDTLPSYTGDDVLYGDVNVDGKVNVSDVVALNKYILSPSENSLKNDVAYENADVAHDGKIMSNDGIKLLSAINGNISNSELGK